MKINTKLVDFKIMNPRYRSVPFSSLLPLPLPRQFHFLLRRCLYRLHLLLTSTSCSVTAFVDRKIVFYVKTYNLDLDRDCDCDWDMSLATFSVCLLQLQLFVFPSPLPLFGDLLCHFPLSISYFFFI